MAAVRKVEDLTSDPDFMGYYNIEERITQDMEDARNTGINEGKAIGIEERNMEIAKEMYEAGEPLDKIQKYTHLSTEEINKRIKK